MVFMQKIKQLIFIIGGLILGSNGFAQSIAPASGNVSAASKAEATSVNNYTGIPSISVPIYNYSHQSGLNMNISLDYFAGGIKVADAPSSVGMSWNLNVGGIITRTVRGIPDDCPSLGYFYTPVLKNDERSFAGYYHNNCLDAEQDIFQFSFAGKSGKFYIGKDSVCYVSPQSKMKVELTKRVIDDDVILLPPVPLPLNYFDGQYATLQKFTITAEDGTKFIFDEIEVQKTVVYSCQNGGNEIQSCRRLEYGTTWHLSKIISYSGKDSIKINYKSQLQISFTEIYQTASIDANGAVTHNDMSYPSPSSCDNPFVIKNKIPTEIILPDSKKVQLYYSQSGQFRYNEYPILQRIKIMDSVFRYGYILNWDTTNLGTSSRGFLSGINYYTQNTIKQGYQFTYNSPIFNFANSDVLYKKDHWGYYNGANNVPNIVPTVTGLYNGANRNPNALAIASSINSIKDPTGAITYYEFENNDSYPFENTKQTLSLDLTTNTNAYATITKIVGKKMHFKIVLTSSRVAALPITGNGNLIVNFTNLSNNSVFSTSVNLKNLYYNGFTNFSCQLPNGNYLMNTNMESGTASSAPLQSNISWYNQTEGSGIGNISAGIRIKQIRKFEPISNKIDTISTFKYIKENGKSSGFLGAIPIYNYFLHGKTNITSRMISDNDYVGNAERGYSRVEVIKGSETNNLGKQVFEYTNIDDFDFDNAPMEYPYFSPKQTQQAFGLPKKVSVFDNTGRLIQTTKNIFNYIPKNSLGDSVYCSMKIAKVAFISIDGFIAQKYYPEIGRVELTTTIDTFYHTNNSITTNRKDVFYDTNYNVKKITTPYDINKSLSLEKRFYYPYDYTLGGRIGELRNSGIHVPVSTESWIMGDGNPRLVSTSIIDFKRKTTINISAYAIMPAIKYSLESNKPILQNNIGTFNPAILVRDTNLIVPQQSFEYSINDKLIQTTQPKTNISKSIIYGYNDNHIIAEVSNAKYNDIAYTSFELKSANSWEITYYSNNGFDSLNAITGKSSFNLTGNSLSKNNLNANETYFLSFWTKGNASLSGATTNIILLDQRSGWSLYSYKISNFTNVTLWGNGLIDEVRLYPIGANMTTSTYEPFGELNSVCDANSNIIYYEYDNVNRIKIIRDKDKNIIKKYDYSDVYNTIDQTPNWIVRDSVYWVCERDSINGFYNTRVLRTELDINPYSETHLAERVGSFSHIDPTRCGYPNMYCNQFNPQIRQVGAVCETGQKIYTSSTYKITVLPDGSSAYRWVCIYHYMWSDGVISANFQEISFTACTNGAILID